MYERNDPKFLSQFLKLSEEEKENLRHQWAEEEARQRELQRLREEERSRAEAARQRRLALIYDNARQFLKEGLLVSDPDGTISSQELYRVYREWCIREGLPIKPPREFWLNIKSAGPAHGISPSGSLKTPEGKRCRGFRGIRVPGEGASVPKRNA